MRSKSTMHLTAMFCMCVYAFVRNISIPENLCEGRTESHEQQFFVK
jgi:hypothetical protein